MKLVRVSCELLVVASAVCTLVEAMPASSELVETSAGGLAEDSVVIASEVDTLALDVSDAPARTVEDAEPLDGAINCRSTSR